MQGLTFHIRDTAMVENKRDIRALRGQVDRDGKLARENADIEGEAIPRKAAHVLNENVCLTDLIRARVKNSPKSFHFGVRGKRVQMRHESIVFRPTRCDDASDAT